jgi:hypothetical protein
MSRWFWDPNHQTEAADFEAQIGEPSTAGFEAKLGETVATSFKIKPKKIVATDFEVKPEKTVPVVLRSNHWQIIDLGFEAQPRNPHSLSPCGQDRPHTVTPDLPIIRPPSTRPMRPSLILCTRSLIPVMILIADRYATPATCTPRDKQTRFSKWNKDRGSRTTEMSRIQIQISTSQW